MIGSMDSLYGLWENAKYGLMNLDKQLLASIFMINKHVDWIQELYHERNNSVS